MILIDMNQISLASVMMHLNMNKTTKPDENITLKGVFSITLGGGSLAHKLNHNT